MKKLFYLICLVVAQQAAGAACCNSSAATPNIISNDSLAQISLSTSSAKVIGDAPSNGSAIFRKSNDDEWTHTLSLDATRVFADLWQVGAKVPLVYKSRSNTSSRSSAYGMGDVSGTLTYEFLPEYLYSAYKPKGYLFLQTTFPTGSNVYEARKTYAIDARGKGFYTFSLGSLLTKSWQRWDLSLTGVASKSLDKTFDAIDGSTIKVKPSYDFLASIGTGYSLTKQKDLRLGLSLSPVYTGASNVANYKLVWNSTIELNYFPASTWAFTLSYTDQTLMGPAKNTSLERSSSLSARYYFAR
ncbi:MAG: hypothetical protein R3A80_03675 [Bdellovibrionota bacterium]